MYKRWLIIWVLLALAACISKEAALQGEVDEQLDVSTKAVNSLKTKLTQGGGIPNALILKKYATQLAQMNPAMTEAAQLMAKNADADGPMVRALEKRLSDVANTKKKYVAGLEEQLLEVNAVKEAALPDIFNDALADSVNALADLSGGKLARVQGMSQTAQRNLYGGAYAYAAPGANLIGNPMYGEWQAQSDGDYLWQWFAAYWFFDEVLDLDDVFERKHYRYGHWSRKRPYSYYHDHGRYRYTSTSRLKRQDNQDRALAANTAGKPASQRHRSPYARKSPGGGGVSLASRTGATRRATYAASSSGRRSSSPYAFSNSSSSRQGASRTSRGPRSGK